MSVYQVKTNFVSPEMPKVLILNFKLKLFLYVFPPTAECDGWQLPCTAAAAVECQPPFR